MKAFSVFARGAAAALAAGSALAGAPVAAQQAAAAQREYHISAQERAALAPVQRSIAAKDWAAATAMFPAALASARSADAKYVAGQLELQIGIGTNSVAIQAAAVDLLLASGGAEQAELPALYRNQGALALKANDLAKAETAFGRLVALTPKDADAIVNLAKVKADRAKPAEAVALMTRGIALKTAAGQPADESWYKYGLKIAYDARLAAEATRLSQALAAVYPTKQNWRDALLVYRDLGNLDSAGRLDLLRLMRVSKALAGERDWYDYADALNAAGFPGEAKAVLDEGAALRMIDPHKQAFADLLRIAEGHLAADRAALASDAERAGQAASGIPALRIGDAFYGYGEYAKAAGLYRAALAKGGVDAGTARLRLGMALAQSGDRAGAETAFRSVTGARAVLAGYWLTWLRQRG